MVPRRSFAIKQFTAMHGDETIPRPLTGSSGCAHPERKEGAGARAPVHYRLNTQIRDHAAAMREGLFEIVTTGPSPPHRQDKNIYMHACIRFFVHRIGCYFEVNVRASTHPPPSFSSGELDCMPCYWFGSIWFAFYKVSVLHLKLQAITNRSNYAMSFKYLRFGFELIISRKIPPTPIFIFTPPPLKGWGRNFLGKIARTMKKLCNFISASSQGESFLLANAIIYCDF